MTREKLTLNLTTNALERLIGGNTEVETNLRQSIVENFSKKYLKTIVNHELIKNQISKLEEDSKKVRNEIQSKFDNEIKKQIGNIRRKYGGEISNIEFNNEFRKQIDKYMVSKFDQFINNLISSTFDKHENEIKEYINRVIKEKLEKLSIDLIYNKNREYVLNKLTEKINSI